LINPIIDYAHLQERWTACYYIQFSALDVLAGVLGSREAARVHHVEDVIRLPNNTFYTSVSQPPDRGPVAGPGFNYTGPREVLLEFVILVF